MKKRLRYPEGDDTQLIRFILRDGKLFTFHNLHDPKGPFTDVIDRRQVETRPSKDFWEDAEGHRRFIALMNSALFKYTDRLGVRFDPMHRRFYFPADEAGKPKMVSYRPLNATRCRRSVVLQPKRKSTGQPKGYWLHSASGLRFHRMAARQWCMSLRPEFHLTKDGSTVLSSDQIGRRVTSKKAKMRNYDYLREVNFWRDFLSNCSPRIVLNFGDQSAVIGTEFLAFDVSWPGVPDDDEPFKNQTYAEDLFTKRQLDSAVEGVAIEWESHDGDTEEKGVEDI